MRDDHSLKTPVVLFAFNRVGPLRRVLERVLAARPSTLLLVADGPRPGHPTDVEKCSAVRRLLDDIQIDGVILKNYSESNLGCGRRIASGLDWVFEQYEQAIILEDDVLPEVSLFRYCEELLDRYCDDTRIAMIGGCNFQSGRVRGADSYFFSHCVGTLGWATWRRAWRHFDFEMRRWPDFRSSGMLERIWQRPEPAAYWRDRFDEMIGGRDDVWDYQWAFAMWSRGALEIYPNCNLVSHIGCTADATHVSSPEGPLCNQPTQPMIFPLSHPTECVRNLDADLFEFHRIFTPLPAEALEGDGAGREPAPG